MGHCGTAPPTATGCRADPAPRGPRSSARDERASHGPLASGSCRPRDQTTLLLGPPRPSAPPVLCARGKRDVPFARGGTSSARTALPAPEDADSLRRVANVRGRVQCLVGLLHGVAKKGRVGRRTPRRDAVCATRRKGPRSFCTPCKRMAPPGRGEGVGRSGRLRVAAGWAQGPAGHSGRLSVAAGWPHLGRASFRPAERARCRAGHHGLGASSGRTSPPQGAPPATGSRVRPPPDRSIDQASSGFWRSKARWSARAAFSTSFAEMMQVILISEVEIISMLMPASARVPNMREA
jgi:hypothetical protein